jgi:hypothetical protein
MGVSAMVSNSRKIRQSGNESCQLNIKTGITPKLLAFNMLDTFWEFWALGRWHTRSCSDRLGFEYRSFLCWKPMFVSLAPYHQ